MVIEKVERLINNWPWASFLVPVWAVAIIIRSVVVLCSPESYRNIAAYEVMYNLAPLWLWAVAGLVVSVAVLVRPKVAVWQILQAALTLMEGLAIFFATIGNEAVSPTAGVTYLAIAGALWLAMVRNLNHVRTPYDKVYKTEKREDDQ